ncbi:MAG: Ig-like domain-containing protein [Bacteroidales bacterium]
MKNLIISLALAAILLACQKEPVLTLEQTNISLKSGENFSISATGFDSYTFTSQDEYVAKVSATGVVTAQRIGKTNIVVKAEDKVAYFNVEVAPAYNFFIEPITEWGMSRAQLVSKLGTPASSTASGVGYTHSSAIAPISVYLFDSKGLSVSSILINSNYSSQLGSFMAERYLPVSIDADEYSIYLINALSLQKATTIVGLKLYNISYWMAAYIRNDSYTKGGMSVRNDNISKKINEIVKGISF